MSVCRTEVYVRLCTACLLCSFGGPTVRLASPSLCGRAVGVLLDVGAAPLAAAALLAAAAPLPA